MNVALNATIDKDGNVCCMLTCDGQKAEVTFTGTEVLMAIPEPKVTP